MNQATRINANERRAFASETRRGVAMLLVIIALGAATILTTAFITSRSDSADISNNMQESSQSYWSAKSAMEVTQAILESDIDWIGAATDGTLVDSMSVAGADVQIKMTNLLGENPSESDTELVVTAVATYNGVTSTFQALVTRQPVLENIADAIDPDMKEFALFARTSLTVDSNGAVTTWRASPAGEGDRAVNIGVGFNSNSNLNLNSGSILNRVKMFVLSTASTGLKEILDSTRFIGGGVIPSLMPVPLCEEPSWASSTPVVTLSSLPIKATTKDLAEGRYSDVAISNESEVTIGVSGQSTRYVFNDLTISAESVIIIRGDVQVVVQDNLEVLDRSTIELADGAQVEFHVRSDVYVDNSAIGFSRSVGRNSSRPSGSGSAYMDPKRIKFYLTNPDGFDPDPEFGLTNRSLVIGAVHAPKAELKIESNSALYGRATASIARIYSTGKLYYDPCLDMGVGFTALNGPLYNSNGTLISDVIDLLDEVPIVSTVTQLFNVLGLGGSSSGSVGSGDSIIDVGSGSDDGSPTRDSRRVKVKVWPIKAHALERAKSQDGSDEPDGSFLAVKSASADAEMED